MELNWNQEDSIYSFLKDPNDFNGNGVNNVPVFSDNQMYSNPLKMDSNLTKTNGANINDSEFKLIPLPDDIFGFDPVINQQSNIPIPSNIPMPSNSNQSNFSFNIDNYLKADIDTNFIDIKNAVPGFTDIIEPEFVNDDIEKVLLDLGISEAPSSKDPNFQPQDKNETNKRNSHKRQLSGSAIFGFVGDGDNTQLSIPGIEPVRFVNKKPLYRDVTNFNNVDFTANNQQNQINLNYYESNTPFTPKRQKTTEDKPEYFVSTGNPKLYKFPPSPPRGSFSLPPQSHKMETHTKSNEELNNNVKSNIFNPSVKTNSKPIPIPTKGNSNNDSYLENPQIFTSSPMKSTSQTPIPTSPLNNIPMSSPLKKDNFQTPLTSPRKNHLPSQIGTQSKFKVSKSPQKTEDTTILLEDNDNDTNDNDETISAMATPSKRSNVTYDYLNTPTKMKVLFSGGPAGDGSSKENGSPQRSYLITQKMKGFNKRSMTRKKPTIATTLATGTLDQYFVGPDENKKFICKFFDKEVQSVCNREFGRISNIRAHIQTHLSDRPFVCDICQKAFVRNHDLKRHRNSHTGVANTCPCGKKFPRADALKRHRYRNICIGGLEPSDGISKPKNGENSNIADKITRENANKLFNTAKNYQADNCDQQPSSHGSQVAHVVDNVQEKSDQVSVFNGYQREETPIIQTRTESQNQQTDMTALFNFSEIPVADGSFNFDLEDSLVM